MQEKQLKFKDKFSNFKQSLAMIQQHRNPITLLCDNIDDAQNIGGLFRLADACNLEEIIFYHQQPLKITKKMERIARQTVDYIPYRTINDLDKINQQKYQILALELTNKSSSIWELTPRFPVLLILGNERSGVSQELLKFATNSIHIPMFGVNNSMNVTNAAGVAVYELVRKLKT